MREIMKTPNLEWCEIMRKSSTHPLYSVLVNIVNSTEPKVVHKCPYNGFMFDNKVPDISSLPSIFSTGYYKLWVNATDRNKSLIFTIEILIDWISSDKNSFG